MDLPKEIIQTIATHLDDKSVLNIRLINTKWSNSIKNIHFPVYLPISDTLPVIINSLSRYDSSIGLTIHKPCKIQLREFIQQIAKLSNLTALTVPYFSDFDHDPSHSGDRPNWLLLTNLTRLHEINLINPKRTPIDEQPYALEDFLQALVHLPQLATLQLTNCNYTRQLLDKYVTLLTRLESMSAPMIPSPDLFPFMSTHLTRLCFSLPAKIAVINEVNIYQKLKVLQLLGTDIQHLSLNEISSLVTLEVSAKRVTGIENNTQLRRLVITAHSSTFYDQIRKLPNLEELRIRMFAENKDPYYFSEFNKLTSLFMLLQHDYDVSNISSSVRNLNLELELPNFEYANLSVLTSLDTLTVGTMYCHMPKSDYLASISTLTGLTNLTAITYDHLQLANLSTLANLELLEAGSCIAIETSFLSHLSKLRAFSNNKLTTEHYREIATLTRLTHLNCHNADDEQSDFKAISHLPLRVLSADVSSEEDLNTFLNIVTTMTSLELLAVRYNSDERICDMKEMHVDWGLLSTLTRLTRLDLDIHKLTNDTLTPLTRVTSLQYLYIPQTDSYDDSDDEDAPPKPSLNDWAPLLAKCYNLVSVAYTGTSVYIDPHELAPFEGL